MTSALLLENLRISLQSIRSHLLRTILTVMIIAFGIMALVGILTAIDSIKYYLNSNFTMMGANSFTIRNRSMNVHMGHRSNQPRNFPYISYDQAMRFKEEFSFPATTCINIFASGGVTIKYNYKKTNPNIAIIGSDENYIATSGNEIEKGRNFSPNELSFGTNVVIIGVEIYNKIFDKNEDPIDKVISIGAGTREHGEHVVHHMMDEIAAGPGTFSTWEGNSRVQCL